MDRPTCQCGKPCASHGIRYGKRVWKTVCSACREGVNRTKANGRNHRHYKRKKLYIRAMKMKPCADCGIQYDWWKMQFDHIDPSAKQHNLSEAHKLSWVKIDAELAKCDVVCVLCHADRTYKGKHYLTRRGECEDTMPDPQCDLFSLDDIS